MPFRRFFDRRRRERLAHDLYLAAVTQARQPHFYAGWGVPDSVDGRFDLIVMHAFLVMRRLGRVAGDGGDEAKALSQAVFDLMFADMDQQLREMGVTDLAVGRKVRQMAEAFFGRVSAYDKPLAEGDAAALGEALARNLYRSATPRPEDVAAMAAYLVAQEAHVSAQSDSQVLAGRMTFRPAEAQARRSPGMT